MKRSIVVAFFGLQLGFLELTEAILIPECTMVNGISSHNLGYYVPVGKTYK